MNAIPNQLKITINTSIPGYQKIEYKPYMTIPEINKDDTKIIFNPLVKLNKNYVDKVPEELRKKQFFNEGLFDSLLNFTNRQKAKSLLEATRKGYVDNNIKITLDTIFSENSVIYINKKPYAIADVQWSSGNWKIDTKIKPLELDSSKITDPYLYQTIVKDEIISGENQLKSLPPVIIYGDNYTGSKNDTNISTLASGTTKVTPKPQETPLPTSTDLVVKNTPDDGIPKSESKDLVVKNTPQNNNPTIQNGDDGNVNDLLQQNINNDNGAPTKSEYREINIQKDLPELKLSYNNISAGSLSSILSKYYDTINTLFVNSNKQMQEIITNALKNTTSIQIKDENQNLSKSAYVASTSVQLITGNNCKRGCFFLAVSNAINIHNFSNPDNKITSGDYGNSKNFTRDQLRELVLDYITSYFSTDLNEYLRVKAPSNAIYLNNAFNKRVEEFKGNKKNKKFFKDELNDSLNNELKDECNKIILDIFRNNNSFLISYEDNLVDDNNKIISDPFKVVEKNKVDDYILSDKYFGGDKTAIDALCFKLKLNVIPIEHSNRYNKNGKKIDLLNIPYANFLPSKDNLLGWDKYLFLYYNKYHYDILAFPQIKETQKTKKIIFINNDKLDELPPIYILFLIYCTSFSSIEDINTQQLFTFKQPIMETINKLILNIYNGSMVNNNKLQTTQQFKNFIENYFPSVTHNFDYNYNQQRQIPSEQTNQLLLDQPTPEPSPNQEGGINYRPNNLSYIPNYIPKYNNQYLAQNMIKKEKDNSQIAYYITIDMELRPGTTLTSEEIKNAKCNRKLNSIKKSWSGLTGAPYSIQPLYTQKNPRGGNKTRHKRILFKKNMKKRLTKKNKRNITKKSKTNNIKI